MFEEAIDEDEGPPSTATRQVGELLLTLEQEREPGLFGRAVITRNGVTVATAEALSEGFMSDGDPLQLFQEGDRTVILLEETEVFPRKHLHLWRSGPDGTHALPPINAMVIAFIADVDGDGRLEVGGDPQGQEGSPNPDDLLVLEIGEQITEDSAAARTWARKAP